LLGISDGAIHDFFEPSTAARNRSDQSKASLGAIGPDIVSNCPMRHQDLPESL
jgi:hypothetical protein